jgi:hypothetical protein
LIERMSVKKAKATHRVAFRGFGLDQFVGKSAERSVADNPKIIWARFFNLLY